MRAKGFAEFKCTRRNFNRERQERFRDKICGWASEKSERSQEQLERVLGERPAVLCGMAEVVLGQWDAKEARK